MFHVVTPGPAVEDSVKSPEAGAARGAPPQVDNEPPGTEDAPPTEPASPRPSLATDEDKRLARNLEMVDEMML